MEMNCEEQLKNAFEQAKDLDLARLLSGLTILVKDTADFIHTNGLKDKTWLELISKLAKKGNQASWFLYPLMLYFVLLLKTSDFITLK